MDTLAAPEARRRHHGVGFLESASFVIFYNACVRLKVATPLLSILLFTYDIRLILREGNVLAPHTAQSISEPKSPISQDEGSYEGRGGGALQVSLPFAAVSERTRC